MGLPRLGWNCPQGAGEASTNRGDASKNDDLASGFQDVDRAADFAVFSSCLTLVESIPFVAYDNDWETLTVDAADRVLTRTVLNAWCDRFPSGWIGRRLVPLFLQAGLHDVVTSPKTLVLRELDVADRLYCFFATVGRLAEAGFVGREDAARWSVGLRAADGEGLFFQLVHRVLGARDTALGSSPLYARSGRMAFRRRASNMPNSTLLGTVLKATRTRASGSLLQAPRRLRL